MNKYSYKLYKLKLHVLHIADDNHLSQMKNKNINFMNEYFPNCIHDYMDLRSNDIYEVVHQYLENNGIQMLVMLSEKHSFLERLFTRHPVEIFAFNIDIPFLVLPV